MGFFEKLKDDFDKGVDALKNPLDLDKQKDAFTQSVEIQADPANLFGGRDMRTDEEKAEEQVAKDKLADDQKTLEDRQADYFKASMDSLNSTQKIMEEQFNISKQEFENMNNIFRPDVDSNDPRVMAALKKAVADGGGLEMKAEAMSFDEFNAMNFDDFAANEAGEDLATPEAREKAYNEYKAALPVISGLVSEADSDEMKAKIIADLSAGDSVDGMLFDAVKSSSGELSLALTDYADKMVGINQSQAEAGAGMTTKFMDKLNEVAGTYQQKLDQVNQEFKGDTKAATQKYGQYTQDKISEYQSSVGKYQTNYERIAQDTQAKMGTADDDILARTTGVNLAGISQSFKESQDNLMSTMSRRGLAGSGVEVGAMSQMGQQEAMSKAGALSNSYLSSVGQSDQRRMTNLGVQQGIAQQGIANAQGLLGSQMNYSNTQLGADLQGAQGIASMYQQNAGAGYQAGQATAQGIYGAGMSQLDSTYANMRNLAGTQYGAQTSNIQQNLANLTGASGVSSGVFGQGSNMLAGASSTAGQSASTSTQGATSYANMQNQYGTSQMNNLYEQQGFRDGQMANMGTNAAGIVGSFFGMGG